MQCWRIEITISTRSELDRADIRHAVTEMLQGLGADGKADCSIVAWENMAMTREEYQRLVTLAKEKDPVELDRLWQIYCTTDMPRKEYLAHLRLIAGE